MSRTSLIILIIASLTILTISASGASTDPRLSPTLREIALTPETDSLVDVVVILKNQDLKDEISSVGSDRSFSRSERIKEVTGRLRSYETNHADQVAEFLNEHAVGTIIRHWVMPAFSATVPASMLDELAALDGVNLVMPDAPLDFDEPVQVKESSSLALATNAQIELLNVPAVWKRGLTGKGRLVCSFDTGVEQSHPALSSKWRGNHAPLASSWFSTIKPDSLPYDVSGHGTHTMGSMIGSAGADTFGVAPGAEFITAGVIDQGKSLSATVSDIIQAFEWALNPDGDTATTDDVPDVILNSWGIPAGLFDDCDETFWEVIDNVEAAGIVTIFAAGNEGPDPQTIRNPADRSSTPINSFSIGAVDNDKNIASFSSRGPSSCDPTHVKPEVVAPGVNIWSSTKGGGYSIMSGTSMAAPFIAGMVALCREYNPEATVEEIKWAFINAAEDLGTYGEDNEYGYGLVNALRVLDFIPEPFSANVAVSESVVVGAEAALPGDTVQIRLTVTNTKANLEQAIGRIKAESVSDASVLLDEAEFIFDPTGFTATNPVPFEVVFEPDLMHGSEVAFYLYVETTDGDFIDSVDFALSVGYAPVGSIDTHDSGEIDLSVSDFGQYGLAPGSIYNVGGDGFRFDGSVNLLYEAGILMTGADGYLAGSVRGETGEYRPSDFAPVTALGDKWDDTESGYHLGASFADARDGAPAVRVNQQTIDFSSPDDDGLVLVRYFLVNESSQPIDSVRFGFLADFDLPGDFETASFDDSLNMAFQYSDSGPMVGLVMLGGLNSLQVLGNDGSKTGLSDDTKTALLAAEGIATGGTDAADVMILAASAAQSIPAGDSVEITFALVAAYDLTDLCAGACQARKRLDNLATEHQTAPGLPETFVLNQNYPNPFNPATTISFTLDVPSEITLEIYNTLGQRVTVLLEGSQPAGEHSVIWDGTDSRGDHAATGVYFYRLSTADSSKSRKMVLLK